VFTKQTDDARDCSTWNTARTSAPTVPQDIEGCGVWCLAPVLISLAIWGAVAICIWEVVT